MPTAPVRWSHPLSFPSSAPTAPFRPPPRERPPDLEADRLACLLKTALERISAPLARAAAALVAREAWTDFGYARLEDHARERYGRSGRWVRDLAALGRGLDGLPGLEEALNGAGGEPAIGFVPALHIARIASPESVPAWLDLARTIPVRQLKERIRLAREAGSSWPVEAAGAEPAETGGEMPPGNDDTPQGYVDTPQGDQATGARTEDSAACGQATGPQGEDSAACGQATGPQAGHLDTDDEAAEERAGDPGSADEMAGEWLRVRLLAPRPVRIAFEEGLELCRAVEGHEVPVSVYVDALVAEASTGASPADAGCLPVLHGRTQADMEKALEEATEGWRRLEEPPPGSRETGPDEEIEPGDAEAARLARLLQRFLQGSSQAGPNGTDVFHETAEQHDDRSRQAPWVGASPTNVFHETAEGPGEASRHDLAGNGGPTNVLHGTAERHDDGSRQAPWVGASPTNAFHATIEDPDAVIRQLLALQDRCERQLGRLLARLSDQGAWRRLQFAGLGHYAEQRLGLARSTARERARLARGLRTLPAIRQAYDDGRLGSVAALCLVRMLEKEPPDEAVQREWVERAAGATVKRLRDEQRELDRRQANERSPRTDRQVSERSPHVRRPLTDAEWHRSLHREPGTARARVARLGRDATVLSFANSIFSVSLPADLAAAFLSAIESARRSLQDSVRAAGEEPGEQAGALYPDRLIPSGAGESDNRAHARGIDRPAPAGDGESGAKESLRRETDARPSLSIARKLVAHGHEVPAWVGLLALIEEFVATWDVAQHRRRPSEDAVHIRDGWRCMAPGCTSRRNLQEHHLRYRSQGGGDEMDNRLCLCAFHHQWGEHGDLGSCRGRAPLGIEWSLGRRGRGGLFRNEIRVTGHETDRLHPGQDHALAL